MISRRINIIVAVDEKNGIGKNNKMLWHLPKDFKYFKEVTMGHPVAMGRRTYDSIRALAPRKPYEEIKPLLPGRRTIVFSRKTQRIEKAYVVASSEQLKMAACKKTAKFIDSSKIFIIGGGEIYQQYLPEAVRVYLTRVHTVIEADTFFPALGENEWELVSAEKHYKDDKHAYDFTFEVWERKNK